LTMDRVRSSAIRLTFQGQKIDGCGNPRAALGALGRPGRELAAKFTLQWGAAATPVTMEVPV
jgi:hypothetical protein